MKHIIFRSIAIAAALLATAVNAGAQQYNTEGGVATSKQVTGPDANGNYTIRLETFATGTTTVTETATPVDVVLVLDMSSSMAEPKGSATRSTKTSYSYDDIVNKNSYMIENGIDYFRINGNYYEQIFGEFYNNRYYLYVYPGGGKVYLTANGGTTNSRSNAASATSSTAPIVTPNSTNSSYFYQGTSRIHALKKACGVFIESIELNDHQDKQGNERDERLHNRISIIKYAGNGNTGDYNRNETVKALTLTENNVESLKQAVNDLIPMGATEAGEGMRLANSQLANARADANRVVVMFTDGEPSDNYAAIGQAYTSKHTYNAIVFSVGTFTQSPSPTSGTYRYLNYVSSNYPDARSFYNGGTGSDQCYYKDASGSVDLSSIFKAISEGIGGSTEPIGSSTQVRDVVTNSFVLPNTVTAADVHVYTSVATGAASGGDDEDPEGWESPVEVTSTVGVSIVNVDANGNPTENADEVKNKALFVTGFEYSKDDSSEGAGDGNWVGPRYKNGKWTWAGKKVIITFKVKADPEATGGESLTNTGKSGVYVQGEDGYTCVNHYEQPHTTLSVNIKIRKTGLRRGESATFELMRIRPKGYNPNGATLKDKVANLQYNIIGKPIPDTHPYSGSATQPDMSDYYEGMGWESFKKVILTNMREDAEGDGKEVVKDILALDPYWVYMVLEDDWGWAYTMSGDANQVGEDGTYTTSSVEVNPFRFHNTEEAGAVKHAEAIMINHFQSSESDAKVEHRKSSKVESF